MSISMNSAINAYKNAANITKSTGEDASPKSTGSDTSIFSGLVTNPVETTINSLRKAESASIGSITKQADITDVVTAVAKAETTLKTVIAVRDRLVGAFQDLEKMPI